MPDHLTKPDDDLDLLDPPAVRRERLRGLTVERRPLYAMKDEAPCRVPKWVYACIALAAVSMVARGCL
jgi:hypothetical protein